MEAHHVRIIFFPHPPEFRNVPVEWRVTVGSYINRDQVDLVADAASVHVIRSAWYGTGAHPPTEFVLIRIHRALEDSNRPLWERRLAQEKYVDGPRISRQ